MTFAERIKSLRLERGLTQKELGERCGMADSAIRKYESGKVVPGYESLFKIAKALGIEDYRIIFDDDGEMFYETKEAETRAHEEDARREALLKTYWALNEVGRKVALERLKELTKIPEYKKEK
ncbi:MAG: helix-turn-helix domain-containing protein [Clostridia bacterium]|nr:helix-turn-helix domain-containing protein [Clostridia bacterium]